MTTPKTKKPTIIKATKKGTCQICGRVQKLPNGKIAKHGYQVVGEFHGTCDGSDHLPLEVSYQQLPMAITKTQQRITYHTEVLKGIKAGTMVGISTLWYSSVHDVLSDDTVVYFKQGGKDVILGPKSDLEWVGRKIENLSRTVVMKTEQLLRDYRHLVRQWQAILDDWQPTELYPLDYKA